MSGLRPKASGMPVPMMACSSPSSSRLLSDLPDLLALTAIFFAVGRMVGLPCPFALLMSPSIHSQFEKSMPNSSLSRPRYARSSGLLGQLSDHHNS